MTAQAVETKYFADGSPARKRNARALTLAIVLIVCNPIFGAARFILDRRRGGNGAQTAVKVLTVLCLATNPAGAAVYFILEIALNPHMGAGAKIAYILALSAFIFYTASIFLAIGWAGLSSLKKQREFIGDMISLPKNWLFKNYLTAFEKLNYNGTSFVGMFINSIWFAVGSSLLSVFLHCVTGYCFAKYKFLGKEAALSFIIFTLILPVVGNLPSMYRIITTIGVHDSPLLLITALGGFGGNFLITYAFFKGIDGAYAEAAQIDGAGHLYIFLRIMLPLAAAPIFALSIVGIIGQWNNYETPMLFLDRMPTLSSGLVYYKSFLIYESNTTVFLAGVIMTTLPILILVCVFGSKIMTNMTMGALKG